MAVSSHPRWACIQVINVSWFPICNNIHVNSLVCVVEKVEHEGEVVDAHGRDGYKASVSLLCASVQFTQPA